MGVCVVYSLVALKQRDSKKVKSSMVRELKGLLENDSFVPREPKSLTSKQLSDAIPMIGYWIHEGEGRRSPIIGIASDN